MNTESALLPNHSSLYVHIPFCLSRCGYCTFASGIYDAALADAYLDALQKELRSRNIFNQTQPKTVFIGGGTPSCLSSGQLEKLLGFLPIQGEATVELNPDSITPEKMQILRAYGINRCSFGVQTFSDRGLRLLERRHDAATAIRAVEMAVAAGFPSINLDLIHGWPEQDGTTMQRDLAIAMDLGIQHISNYSLILEDDAPAAEKFFRMLEGAEKDEESARRYWEIIEEYLESKGFIHYETSNFCLPGHCCRHNVLTWKGGEYCGLGLAAHSHLSGRRFGNTCDMEKYLKYSAFPEKLEDFSEVLEPEAKARECAVFWLRLFAGVNLVEFAGRTGMSFLALYTRELPSLLSEGIMEYNATGSHIRVARHYQPVLDEVLSLLV